MARDELLSYQQSISYKDIRNFLSDFTEYKNDSSKITQTSVKKKVFVAIKRRTKKSFFFFIGRSFRIGLM